MLALWSSGCATIIHGTHQRVSIQTDPPGATARMAGMTCETPGALQVDRQSPTQVVIEKEGYKSKTVNLETSVDPLLFLNCLCTSVVGIVVDLATGGGFSVEPEHIRVRLEPLDVATIAPVVPPPPPSVMAAPLGPPPKPLGPPPTERTLIKTPAQVAAEANAALAELPPLVPEEPSGTGLVAVMPLDTQFANMDAPARFVLDEELRNVLRDVLGGPGYTVLSGEATLAALADMHADPGKPVDAPHAIETARAVKSQFFVSGSCTLAGGQYSVLLRLVDTATGQVVSSAVVEAPSVPALRDQIAAKTRQSFVPVLSRKPAG